MVDVDDMVSRWSPPSGWHVGLGTFRSKGEDVRQAVITGLGAGFRHIDTASIYKNEEDIGQAVRMYIEESSAMDSPIMRKDIHITSKLSPYEQGDEIATKAIDDIVERLGLEYIDLLLIHWPGTSKIEVTSPVNAQKRKETWRAMERALYQGKCKAIGVSNYEIRHLEELLGYCAIAPSVNQVEVHPLWPQNELREYCSNRDVAVVGYSPFSSGELLNPNPLPEIMKAAVDSGKTASQTLCCWGLQKGLAAVVPKSIRPDRILEVSPTAAGMLPDSQTGRYLSEKVEILLDSLGSSPDKLKKFCWDPAKVL